MSINNVDPSWLKQERVMTGTINLKPVLEEVWDDLSNKTREVFFNPKPRMFYGMFSSKKATEDYFKLERAARRDDGEPTPTSDFIDNYFRPLDPRGGRKRRTKHNRRTKRKTKKSKKAKRSRRARRTHK